jgi:hypothetical protein
MRLITLTYLYDLLDSRGQRPVSGSLYWWTGRSFPEILPVKKAACPSISGGERTFVNQRPFFNP